MGAQRIVPTPQAARSRSLLIARPAWRSTRESPTPCSYPRSTGEWMQTVGPKGGGGGPGGESVWGSKRSPAPEPVSRKDEAGKMRSPWRPEKPASRPWEEPLSANQVIFSRSHNCRGDTYHSPAGLSVSLYYSGKQTAGEGRVGGRWGVHARTGFPQTLCAVPSASAHCLPVRARVSGPRA